MNAESYEAWLSVLPHLPECRQVVLEAIADHPSSPKEIAERLQKPLHAISGRCTELKDLQLVEPTAEVRDGSRVLQLKLTQ